MSGRTGRGGDGGRVRAEYEEETVGAIALSRVGCGRIKVALGIAVDCVV